MDDTLDTPDAIRGTFFALISESGIIKISFLMNKKSDVAHLMDGTFRKGEPE